jgi:hypothetical protein
MDPLKRKELEERVFEEVQTILTEGDCPYLQGLSRAALLEALGACPRISIVGSLNPGLVGRLRA